MASSKDKKSAGDKVAEQARLMETPGTPWYIVSKGTLTDLMSAFPPDCPFSQLSQSFQQDYRSVSTLKRGNGAVAKDAVKDLVTTLGALSSFVDELDDTIETPQPGQIPSPRPGGKEVADEVVRLFSSDSSKGAGGGAQSPKERQNVYTRGAVGDNIFHLCMLIRSQDKQGRRMIKYLVEVFGAQLINTPYQARDSEADPPGPYEGETAIHIAVVNQDFQMVKFLVENGADLTARAWGTFFKEGGNCHYGEYPLSFAVCMGNGAIVRYLVAAGANIDLNADSAGNSALHMAVFYCRKEMYDLLVDEFGASTMIRNNQGQTPLTLAAAMGNEDMYEHILHKQTNISWIYGPVTCYSLPLDQIDSVQDDPKSAASSILNMVNIPDMKTLEILTTDAMHVMFQRKWDKFAWKWFYLHLVIYVVDMLIFSALVYYARYKFFWTNAVDDTSVMHWSYLGYRSFPAATQCNEEPFEPSWRGQAEPNYYSCTSTSADWMYGPDRFNTTGVTLEVMNLVFILFHTVLHVYDTMTLNELHKSRMEFMRGSRMNSRRMPFVAIPGTAEDPSILPSSPCKGDRARRRWSLIKFWVKHNEIAKFESRRGLKDLLHMDAEEMLSYIHRKRSSSLWQSPMVWMTTCALSLYANTRSYLTVSPDSVTLWLHIIPRYVHFFAWVTGTEIKNSMELAVAAVFGWLFFFYFCRGFRRVGYLVVMLQQMIIDDVFSFAIVFVVIIFGFACALFLLVRHEFVNGDTGLVEGEFNNMMSAQMTLLRMSLGDIHYASMTWGHEDAAVAAFTSVLFAIWGVMSNIVMINMLIALMGNTFQKVSENAEMNWRLQWARIILVIERRLPTRIQQKNRLGEKMNEGWFYVFEEVSEDMGIRPSPLTEEERSFGEGLDQDGDALHQAKGRWRRVKEAFRGNARGEEPPPMVEEGWVDQASKVEGGRDGGGRAEEADADPFLVGFGVSKMKAARAHLSRIGVGKFMGRSKSTPHILTMEQIKVLSQKLSDSEKAFLGM